MVGRRSGQLLRRHRDGQLDCRRLFTRRRHRGRPGRKDVGRQCGGDGRKRLDTASRRWRNHYTFAEHHVRLPGPTDLTAAAFHQGWYRTGDRGSIDQHGRLWLTGRIKDEINRAGFKVQPAEIDAMLERNPAVAEACVFGISDPLGGEAVAAAIRLNNGATRAPRASRRGVLSGCAERPFPSAGILFPKSRVRRAARSAATPFVAGWSRKRLLTPHWLCCGAGAMG